jgi:tetratricopeptide (TPR) repeat protein
MLIPKARGLLFMEDTAGFALAMLLSALTILLPASAQKAPAPHETYVGILVTHTAEDAERALKDLKAGADFGVLAKERSIDATANDGGFIGRQSLATLQPELRAAVSGLKAGEFSGVVRVSAGFAVLTVFRRDPNTQDLDAKRILSLTSSGAVRQSLTVAGMDEADASFNQFPKPDGWNRDPHQACSIRVQSHKSGVEGLEQLLSPPGGLPPGKFQPVELLRGHMALAQLLAFTGELDKSIAEWKLAYQIAQSSVPKAIPYLQESLGTTYLHLSETENGVYRDSGSQDIFPPLNPGASYPKKQNSELAIQYFQSYLAQKPDDLEVKWLLNLAYMTLGDYPAKVPPKDLIPLSRFESKQDIGRFTDVAPSAGLNVFSEAGGVLVDDFDNDGLLDVVTSSMDMCAPLHFFHNNGDGTFTDRSKQAGLDGQLGGLNIVEADYNNDGCMDILVLRGGWEQPVRRSLLRNNCDGTFTDVTVQSGLGGIITATQTATWADIDNDGYLDLFIGNENAPSQLFRNKGDGTFEDISHAAGIDKTAFTKGVAAADYDKDGYVDFYVSNGSGANFLYHNNHDRTFTEIGRQAGVQAPYFSFATWFFDYDNDGWPDIFVNTYFSSTDQVMRSYLGLPVSVETIKLYRNLHNGAFEDVTAKVGLDKVFMPMGSNFGDVDNDGFLDIYLGMGNPSFTTLMPHVLLRNDGGKAFVDITASSGTGELHKGHGIAFADLERNGHEDIVAETGGAVPADKHTLRLFKNPGNDNDWINVHLTGVKSNRAAVGAEIKLTVQDDGGAPRTIYRTVGDTSSFGGNPMEQHIGLGHGAHILSLEIWWPATNTRQKFADVEKDQFVAIKEFDTAYTRLERKPLPLGKQTTAAP